jgi:hypothetical protein
VPITAKQSPVPEHRTANFSFTTGFRAERQIQKFIMKRTTATAPFNTILRIIDIMGKLFLRELGIKISSRTDQRESPAKSTARTRK